MSGAARGVVGVLGAGVIGTTVAQDLAQTGHDVVLVDSSAEALENAQRKIARDIRFHNLVASPAEPTDPAAAAERLTYTTDYATLSDAYFVIENVTEDVDIKRAAYQQLDAVCGPECVYAANTSAVPIGKIAAATNRPDRVLGMHFMNPSPLKPVVEVIRGAATSDETLATAMDLLAGMNKSGVVVADSPGFVSNRVLMLTINEAIALVAEEVASAADIDTIFKECFGHAMGPLETADLIGLDTIMRTLLVLEDEYGEDRFAPNPLLRTMVDNGQLGRKTGHGFHTYQTAGN